MPTFQQEAGARRNAFGGIQPGLSPFGMSSPQPSLSFKQAYPASVGQAGEDYDSIMAGYRNLYEGAPSRYADLRAKLSQSASQPKLNYSPYNYSRSPEVSESFGRLRGLAETGGYAPEELASLRERGISPIRSVYANAQRNLDRSRVLSGGYSPNYGAATSRMAREMSEQLAGATTNVNAAIAERVAAGRQAAIPQFAEFSASENAAKNRAAEINAARRFEADRFNRSREDDIFGDLSRLTEAEQGDRFKALQGMQSLYGTTPALAALFGQQASQAAELKQQERSSARNAGVALASQYADTRQPNIRPVSTPFAGAPARKTSRRSVISPFPNVFAGRR